MLDSIRDHCKLLFTITNWSQPIHNSNNTVNFSHFPVNFFAAFRIRPPLRTQGRKEEAEEGRESEPYIFSETKVH